MAITSPGIFLVVTAQRLVRVVIDKIKSEERGSWWVTQ